MTPPERSGLLHELRRMTSDASLVAIGQVISYAYPLVSIPLLSRVLGIDNLGVLIAALAVLQMLIVWIDFGFGFSALRRIAVAETPARRQQVVAATLTAKIILWAVGSAVLLAVVLIVPSLREHLGLYLVGLLSVVGAVFYPMWYLQGVGRLKLLALLTAGSRLIALAGLVLTVRSVDQIDLAVFWQYVPHVLSAVGCWIVLTRAREVRLSFTGLRAAREALRDSVPLFVNLVSGQLIVNSSAILLAQLSSYRQVGLFGPADRMANAVHGVLGSVEQAMLPRVSAAHTHPELPHHRRLILSSLIGCYVAAGLLLVVTAPVIVPWYLGSAFTDAIPVVQLMGAATAIAGFAKIFTLDLVSAGRSRICSIITAVSCGWHLLTAALAAWLWGAEGVAVAVCGTQLFAGVALGIAIVRPGRSRSAGQNPAAAQGPTVEQDLAGEQDQPATRESASTYDVGMRKDSPK